MAFHRLESAKRFGKCGTVCCTIRNLVFLHKTRRSRAFFQIQYIPSLGPGLILMNSGCVPFSVRSQAPALYCVLQYGSSFPFFFIVEIGPLGWHEAWVPSRQSITTREVMSSNTKAGRSGGKDTLTNKIVSVFHEWKVESEQNTRLWTCTLSNRVKEGQYNIYRAKNSVSLGPNTLYTVLRWGNWSFTIRYLHAERPWLKNQVL